MLLGGRPVAGLPTHELIASGLAFVPQTGNVFTTLTIHENLMVGGHTVGAALRRRLDAAYGLFPALAEKRGQRARVLSGGQRQMLAIARALMTEPSVIMLDEPTAGLSPKVVGEVFADLRRLAQSGVAVFMVEQNAKAALRISDRGYVLADGENRFEGAAAALLDDPAVGEAFLARARPEPEVTDAGTGHRRRDPDGRHHRSGRHRCVLRAADPPLRQLRSFRARDLGRLSGARRGRLRRPGTPTGPLSFGWQLIAAMLIAGVLTGGLAWLVDILVFRRLRHSGAHHLSMVFAAFGAALVMRHLIVLIWGHGSYFYTRELQIALQVLPGVRMLPDQIFILGWPVSSSWRCTLSHLQPHRHGDARHGREPRARAGLRRAGRGRGALDLVPLRRARGNGRRLPRADAAGPSRDGFNLLLALFAAAILGGAGSLIGAVVGGLMVGLAENLSVLFISPGYKQAMPFLVLLAVLFVRPQGLFGEKE